VRSIAPTRRGAAVATAQDSVAGRPVRGSAAKGG
jgi:hypothetical protein